MKERCPKCGCTTLYTEIRIIYRMVDGELVLPATQDDPEAQALLDDWTVCGDPDCEYEAEMIEFMPDPAAVIVERGKIEC